MYIEQGYRSTSLDPTISPSLLYFYIVAVKFNYSAHIPVRHVCFTVIFSNVLPLIINTDINN